MNKRNPHITELFIDIDGVGLTVGYSWDGDAAYIESITSEENLADLIFNSHRVDDRIQEIVDRDALEPYVKEDTDDEAR